MMTEQLKHALILVEQLPAEQQDALAALMQQAVAREREQQQMQAAADASSSRCAPSRLYS